MLSQLFESNAFYLIFFILCIVGGYHLSRIKREQRLGGSLPLYQKKLQAKEKEEPEEKGSKKGKKKKKEPASLDNIEELLSQWQVLQSQPGYRKEDEAEDDEEEEEEIERGADVEEMADKKVRKLRVTAHR